jgi:translocation and assembly module TamA
MFRAPVRGAMLAGVLCAGVASVCVADDLAYKAHIEGVPDAGLRRLLEQVSALMNRSGQPPASRVALERRAQGDEQSLQQVLESQGYYAGSVHVRLDEDAQPVEAAIQVDLGPQFTIDRLDVAFTSEDHAPGLSLVPRAANPELPAGVPARAADVLAAEQRILTRLQQSGYPLAKIADQSYSVDMVRHTMQVAIKIDHGGPWTFGPVTLKGGEGVEPGFVLRKAPFKEGAQFNTKLLADYRTALEGTGLFNSILIEPVPAEAPGNGELPVRVTLRERPRRSISVGGKYSTSEGAGLTVGWQHRNLFGRAHTVTVNLTIATIAQELNIGYRFPEYSRSDQTLFAGVDLKNQDTDAFEEKSFTSQIGVERKINKALRISFAAEPEISVIKDDDGTHHVQLLSFPLIANYDTSNDVLDPSHGIRAQLKISPSTGYGDGSPLSFVTIEGSAATYYRVIAKPQTVLALRTRLGFIAGEPTADIPADHRFFAGGGGSIRGYGYQKVGPLDANNDPLGGRAVAEIGGEFRIRVTNSIGLVPFLEAGNVYGGAHGQEGSGIRVGAGLGVRYYTAIGPLRFDVGVPLNRRKEVDDAFQVYVSIGQAF